MKKSNAVINKVAVITLQNTLGPIRRGKSGGLA